MLKIPSLSSASLFTTKRKGSHCILDYNLLSSTKYLHRGAFSRAVVIRSKIVYGDFFTSMDVFFSLKPKTFCVKQDTAQFQPNEYILSLSSGKFQISFFLKNSDA